MIRIISNLIILTSIFILPVYVSVLLIIFATLVFDNFIEAIVMGNIIDIVYGSGRIFGFSFSYFFTGLMIFFYLISFRLKTIVRISF